MRKPPRLAIATLGCKVNRTDSNRLLAQLRGVVEVVPFQTEADIYLINSCTVTAAADRQTRQLVYRARRRNPNALICLMGCLVRVDPEKASEINGVDCVFGTFQGAELKSYIIDMMMGQGQLGSEKPPILHFKEEDSYNKEETASFQPQKDAALENIIQIENRARPFLKIQEGCDNACSYCIVPKARGPSRSILSPASIHEALKLYASKGFHEVVLTGIHVGQYGRDLHPRTSIASLIASCKGRISRIRLSSIEPDEVHEDLIVLLSNEPFFCQHLHIPIQSGDNATLAKMNRPYAREFASELLETVHHTAPNAALGSDFIVGFPGETEEQFRNTLDLVLNSPLTHLHVFPYSPRPGTPAAKRKEQLPMGLVKKRVSLLREAGIQKLERFATSQIGRTLQVVVERGNAKSKMLVGTSENYLHVHFAGPLEWIRNIVPVKIFSREGGDLFGKC